MSSHRFFATGEVPAASDGPFELPLSAQDVHHVVDVLRMRAGERIALVTPSRVAHEVVLVTVARDGIAGEVVRELPRVREFDVTLVQGLAKGSKLELVIEKAVEVGVAAVWPVEFARSVARFDPERAANKGERWRRVAHAAAKQAGRHAVPDVTDPAGSTGLLERLADFDVVLVPWEEAGAGAPGIGEALVAAGASAQSRVAVVVGPEGGLTEHEVAAFVGAGAIPVTLGDTILRTETAGILSVALCVYELGGLGGRSRG